MAAEEDHSRLIPDDKKINVSFNIWPPTQRTREAVTARLIETLSSPSILSKRYGTIPPEEASSTARLIEEEAFSAAAAAFSGNSSPDDNDGIEILQMYSKEISKRMLDAVKARAVPPSPATESVQTPPPPPAAATNEEISSLESETPQT